MKLFFFNHSSYGAPKEAGDFLGTSPGFRNTG